LITISYHCVVATVEEMQSQLAELSEKVEQLTADRDTYRELYQQALEQCRKLELGLRGQKAERLDEDETQLTLAVLSSVLNRDPGEEKKPEEKVQRVKAHTRRKPKRRPLPEHMPRVDVVVLPPEVERKGLDAFEQIGEDVTERVEHRPASFVVVRVRRPKFVAKDRVRNTETQVLIAPTPELPIERSNVGPGMLANSVVRRWQDHLPLHRLEQIYAREGLEFARSTICGWHEHLAALCRLLMVAMWKDALKSPYLCTDATGVLVQSKHRCRHGHFWVVVAPKRHVIYAYSRKHNSDAVDRILSGYKGYLVADAHAVYDHLFKDGEVAEAGCWSHTRRYYFKALTSDPERARHGLALINELFRIECSIATAPRKKRAKARDQESRGVVDKFFGWCDEQVDQDPPLAEHGGIRHVPAGHRRGPGAGLHHEPDRVPIGDCFSAADGVASLPAPDLAGGVAADVAADRRVRS